MPKSYVVSQGECLSSIARAHGFADWHRIYDHPLNAGLRALRPNPQTLYPGDTVMIPDLEAKSIVCGTERRHTFQLRRQSTVLRILLRDELDQPLADVGFEFEAEGQSLQGRTDGDGLLEIPIGPSVESASLTLFTTDDPDGEYLAWEVRIGHLDPVDEDTGLQQRLNNLGFVVGPVDGAIGPWTGTAVRSFQHWAGLSPDGEATPVLRARVLEAHAGI